MGKSEIASTVFRKADSIASFAKSSVVNLVVGSLILLGAFPCWASQTDKQTIAAIEQKLFFKVYGDDDLDARLRRIEKRVFGDSMAGDFSERLAKVTAAVGPQVNPDGTVSGIGSEPQQVVPPPQQHVQPRVPSAKEEADAAVERAKVAVMAAKEEEVAKLLAEGVELWRRKRGPEAIDRFEQVIRLDPHNAEALFSMGIVYESSGNLVEAAASYKRAAQEQPGNKDYQDAVQAVDKKLAARQPLEDKKGELRTLAEEASAAYKRGEYLTALSLYKELDRKAPNQALVKYNIGTLYLSAHDPISALQYYKEAHKLKPGEPRYQQAVDQLDANLKQAEAQQKQTEAAWDQANPQGGMQQQQSSKPGKQPKQPKPPKQPKSNNPILIQPQQQDAMAQLGLIAKSSHGSVVITTIGIASRAAKVGLQMGDVIKAVDGTVVKSTHDINDILSKKQPGSPVQLLIERGKQMGAITL